MLLEVKSFLVARLDIRYFLYNAFKHLTVQRKLGSVISDQKQKNVTREGSGSRKRGKKVSSII
jgi:hypothetical protein